MPSKQEGKTRSERSSSANKDEIRINAKYLQGLTDEQKDRFYKKYKESKEVLLKLRKILEDEVEKSYFDEEDIESLSIEHVAQTIGYRRGIRKALNYIPEES